MRCLRLLTTFAILFGLVGVAHAGSVFVSAPPGGTRDFGNVLVVSGPAAETVTITASGQATISSQTLGAGCGEFTSVARGGLPRTLNNNNTLVFDVTYTPVDRGLDTCVVTLVPGGGDTGTSFTLTGTGTASQIAVTIPDPPLPLVFADQAYNSGAGETLTVTITNSGNAAITGTDIAGMLSATTEFTLGAIAGTPIAGGGGTGTVAVTFNPTSIGDKTATLTVDVSNDLPADGSPTVTVEGKGTQSIATVPGSVTFGAGAVGVARTADLVVMNTGDAPLTISAMTIGVAAPLDGTDFQFTDHGCADLRTCNTPGVIAAGGMSTFTLRCTPGAAGLRAATLTIASDDGTTGARTVLLKCVGDDLALGNDKVGPPATAPQTVTVANPSTSAITYSVVSSAPAEFPVTCAGVGCMNRSLAAGAAETVSVTFQAAMAGARSATLTFTTADDADFDGAVVDLTGTGTEPSIAVAPDPLAFGDVPVADVGGATGVVTVTNGGLASLVISSMSITGDADNWFSFATAGCAAGHACADTITINPAAPPANQAAITLRCDPTMAGDKTATLNIVSDAPTTPTTVMLTCTGTVPDVVVSAMALDFMTQRVLVPSAPAKTFTVANLAGAHVAPLAYAVTVASPDYAIACTGAPGCTGTLAAGASITVSVTFTPQTAGVKMANITVATATDPDEPTTMVMMTGTGVRPLTTLTAPVPGTPPTTGGVLAFGNVANNTTSPTRTITLQNTGDDLLAVTAVTNTAPADFDLVGPATVNLAAGMSQSWTVACDPESRGAKTGQIRLVNDSLNDTSVDVDLTCTSVEAVLGISAAPIAAVAGTIDFGGTALSTMKTTLVTVTNTGNTSATIAAVNLGAANQGFSVTGFVANTAVAAGASTAFTVVFNPTLDAHGATALTVDSDWNDPTVNLTGDGQPTGIQISPNPVALGDVRWDQQGQQIVTITNVGVAPFTVTGASLGGAQPGEFELVGFAATPLNAMGASTTVLIRAIPSDDMLGPRAAILTVTTTLPAGAGQTNQVNLGYTSVGPMVSLEPGMVVDFGDVDVDEVAGKTVMLELTNTGDGLMTVANFGVLAGPFSKVNPADATVVPAATMTIPVTYKPVVERQTPEETTFTITTSGLFVGGATAPAAIQITLRGRGVDQHVQVADVVFPPTYRNPTAAQVPTTTCGAGRDQRCAVTVCNTGTAALHVSMLTDGDADDAFELGATTALTVAPGSVATPSCQRVDVAFRPPGYGAFAGTVTVMNDDEAAPMAEVALAGSGVARPVTVSPETVAHATVAVGAPVLLSTLLGASQGVVLANGSGSETFAVELRLTGDAEIATIVGDVSPLAPSASATHDVELDASATGSFQVEVEVHLDGDPDAHATVAIPVDVVELDLHGGGCDGGGGGAGAVVGLAALGLLLRRRRGGLAAAATVAAVLASAGTARAQSDRGEIDISTFTPAAATEPGLFNVLSPAIGRGGAWAIDLSFEHGANPLAAGNGPMGDAHLIERRDTAVLGFAYALSHKLELGLSVPMLSQSGCDRTTCMEESGVYGPEGTSGTSLGDVAVRVKAGLGSGAVGFGAALAVTAPTAKEGSFAGSRGPTAHLQGLLGFKAGSRLGLALNAGLRARQSSVVLNAEQGTELTYGVGASFRALDKVWAIGEAYGNVGIIGAEGNVSPIAYLLGVRIRATSSLVLGLGGGGGFGQGIGVPEFRGFASISLASGAGPLAPLHVEPPPKPVDLSDDDGDGIINTADKCVTEAEDQDGFEDEDGCAELDNDGDGIADADDKCPAEPEDKDGTDDGDGCADRDDDGDGIADVDDKCPKEPEDKDGFNDNDGCDDPDNDKDGVPDVLDQCALEPETINGNNDDDGCPDAGDSLVMVMQDRIEALEPITFTGTTAKLTKGAQGVLAQIGATLRADQSIKKIRVTVHVHPRGDGDQALSDRRAEEIRKWLLQTGVEPERLDARGIGSQRPLVKPSAKGAEQINDRVEFIIFERRSEAPKKPATPTPPTAPAGGLTPADTLN